MSEKAVELCGADKLPVRRPYHAQKLFEPVNGGRGVLKNRIAMAAMGLIGLTDREAPYLAGRRLLSRAGR